MTEDQIERHVERCFDRYDAALMAGRIDQEAYDTLTRELNTWADNQYQALARARLEYIEATRPYGGSYTRGSYGRQETDQMESREA